MKRITGYALIFCFFCTYFSYAPASEHELYCLRGGANVTGQYVKKGSLKSQQALQPHLLLLIRDKKHGFYLETGANLPTKAKHLFKDEWRFSAGHLYRLTEFFEWDLGGTYTWLKNPSSGQLGHWREIYTGIRTDLILAPSIYLFHDFERRQWNLELSFGYDFELEEFGWHNWALETKILLGWLKAKKPFGGQRGPAWDRKNHYLYIEAGFNLALFLSDSLVFKMGPCWAYNRDGNQPYSVANEHGNHSHLLWWTTGLEFRF